MSITVVGSVALDSVETPFGRGENLLGGSAVHFSASSSFFTQNNLVGVVGEDFPIEFINFLKSRDIDLTGLQILPGKTFHWKGRYDFDLNQAHTLETHLNVLENFQPIIPESYKNPQILFLANIDPTLQDEVIQNCGRPELIALDTMNLWISIKKEALINTMKKVHLVTINEGEARMFTQKNNLLKAARAIQELGPRVVIIKQGEYGALLFFGDKIFSAPAMPLEDITDPTGAGDSFAGGVMGYLSQHQSYDFETFKTALICGSVMASFNVEKLSCDRLREIDAAQIVERFSLFEQLVSFEKIHLKTKFLF